MLYGDQGKGTTVDFLATTFGAETVVRFGGGPQALHNVVSADGVRHGFAQFGSATFRGARTYLARQMLVELTSLKNEADCLERAGVSDPLSRVTVDADCVLVTPMQIMYCRMVEAARERRRLGSCGMGVGQAVEDSERGLSVTVRDILAGKPGIAKFRRLLEFKRMQAGYLMDLDSRPEVVDIFADFQARCRPNEFIDTCRGILGRVKVDRTGAEMCRLLGSGGVIFEGAQGALLDRRYGFAPYITKTRTTCHNALDVMDEVRRSGSALHHRMERVIGVARAYATRHGPGPFVTEEPSLAGQFRDEGNPENRWQGKFRVGWLDLVALRYGAMLNEYVDGLAVTCLDQLSGLDSVRVCTAYEYEGDLRPLDRHFEWDRLGPNLAAIRSIRRPEDGAAQEELTKLVSSCKPAGWVDLPGWKEDVRGAKHPAGLPKAARDYLDLIQNALDLPIWFVSVGPTAQDKFFMF
jgi:adenylosuccinate synthase